MNIVAVAIDTLSARHMSCYGYHRKTTPFIDELARRSTLFETMYCCGIPTSPSFASFYTGQYPITHGIVSHGGMRPLPKEAPWFVKLLRRAGYATCAVDKLNTVEEWFTRGYEFYIDPQGPTQVSQQWPVGFAQQTEWPTFNRRAIPWLQSHAAEKFFLFVHYWDPHTAYMPPEEYRSLFYDGDPTDPSNHSLDGLERYPLGEAWRKWFDELRPGITDAEYIVAMYDSEIRYVDDGVRQLLETVDELGLTDDTMVIIFSDHGEMMYRHGIYFDHHGLYDPDIHVPLIIRWPGVAEEGHRVPHLVQHIDLAPTILEAAGIEIPEQMEGTSLLPYLKGEKDDPIYPYLVSEECTRMMKWALRTDRYKFILARERDYLGNPMRELYDLEEDPCELNNVYEERRDVGREMEEILEGWIQDMMKRYRLTEDPLIANGLTLGVDFRRWVKEHGYW